MLKPRLPGLRLATRLVLQELSSSGYCPDCPGSIGLKRSLVNYIDIIVDYQLSING